MSEELTHTFPCILRFANIFDPETHGPDGRPRDRPRFQVACMTDEATLAAMPEWASLGEMGRDGPGYRKGQRYVRAHSAVRPPVFGLTQAEFDEALRCNCSPDRLLTGRHATVAIGKFETRRRENVSTILCIAVAPGSAWKKPTVSDIIEKFQNARNNSWT